MVLGPDCADPFAPKAVRASMGAIFAAAARAGAAVEATPEPRAALVAHGGERRCEALDGIATVCLGAEREGLPAEVARACDAQVTIPLRPGGAESLNVAAAAAIALQRISSRASGRPADQMLERIEQIAERGRAAIAAAPATRASSRSCGSATWAARPS